MCVGIRPGTQTKVCIYNYFKHVLGSGQEHKQKCVYIIILNVCKGQARNTKYAYIIILNVCWDQARNTNKSMYR